MSIDYIDHITQFDLKFNQFKENSKISTHPAIYHVGLDCEYITQSNFPESFIKSSNWVHQSSFGVAVCLIQIANAKECLVVDITKFNKILPHGLIEILTSGNWIKTGVGIDLDMQYISDNFLLAQCNGHIDMRTHAILNGVNNPNLEFLSGVEKPDYCTLRDWSSNISTQNLKYAGSDGFCSYNIGKQFLKNSSNTFLNKRTISPNTVVNNSVSVKATNNTTNYVGMLQEYVMTKSINKTIIELPKYTDYEANKKTHLFVVECKVKQIVGHGAGQNKMTAKQNAAKEVYTKLIELEKSK
jgi:hypothetical protein